VTVVGGANLEIQRHGAKCLRATELVASGRAPSRQGIRRGDCRARAGGRAYYRRGARRFRCGSSRRRCKPGRSVRVTQKEARKMVTVEERTGAPPEERLSRSVVELARDRGPDPENPTRYYFLGNCLLRGGEIRIARDAYWHCLRVPRRHRALACAMPRAGMLGDVPGAIVRDRRAEPGSRDAEACTPWARLFMREGDEGAPPKKYLEEFLETGPGRGRRRGRRASDRGAGCGRSQPPTGRRMTL